MSWKLLGRRLAASRFVAWALVLCYPMARSCGEIVGVPKSVSLFFEVGRKESGSVVVVGAVNG